MDNYLNNRKDRLLLEIDKLMDDNEISDHDKTFILNRCIATLRNATTLIKDLY